MRNVQRDVEDAVPYGMVRSREVAADLRDIEDAVPYGMVRSHEAAADLRDVEDAVPYGIVRSHEVAADLRDVEDAVPYRVVQISGAVRVYGLPKGKAGQLGKFVMFFLTFLLTKTKNCCTLSLGRRSEAPRRRIVRGLSRVIFLRVTLLPG